MRVILTILIFFFSLLNLKTFGQSISSYGAFGAVSLKCTSILDQNSIIAGGRFGWVINKSIVLGGGFYSLISKVKTHIDENIKTTSPQLNLNYGGLELEYIFIPENPVHFSVSSLFAGGGLYFTGYDKSSANYYGIDLLIWEPSLNLEAKAFSWMYVDLNLSYRAISNFHANYGLTENNIKGFTTGLTIKLGSY